MSQHNKHLAAVALLASLFILAFGVSFLFWPEFYLDGYKGRLVIIAFMATMTLLVASRLWIGDE